MVGWRVRRVNVGGLVVTAAAEDEVYYIAPTLALLGE